MEQDLNTNVINSISELPKGGRYLDLSSERTIQKVREKVAVWETSRTTDGLGFRNIILIVSKDLEKEMALFAIKHQLKKMSYRIEKTYVAGDPNLIRTIQDSVSSDDDSVSESNEITRYYEEMVSAALREKVSDIHIEKRKNTALIRMRKHGQLMQYKELSTKMCLNLCTVIYNVLAENQDVTFMPNEYQAAAVNTKFAKEEVKLRYQSLPVYPDGFDVVLRVLPINSDDEGTPDISTLGYEPNQVKELLAIVSKPVGALIIAGTTGSGKSTTLKNLLMLVNESRGYRCKIYTIEDPPEYNIPKVSQIPVVRRRGEDYTKKSPFEDPLVATMRGDPDILMIGEIRDKFTGDGLKKATQSGHQVLTTTHASSALGVIERLADFGITPSVMGSPEFINGLVYQKLVPMLCSHCSIDFNSVISSSSASDVDLDLAKRLDEVSDRSKHKIRLRNPNGCEKCKNLGVTGRTVCAEVIVPDFQMLRLFRESKSIEAKVHWRSLSDEKADSDNMVGKTVLEHALYKMRKGLVSPHDIEDVLGPVNLAKRSLEEMKRDAGGSAAGGLNIQIAN